MTKASAESLSPAVKRLAARTDAETVAAAVARTVAEDAWAAEVADPAFAAAMLLSVRDNVGAALDLFAGRRGPTEIRPPAAFALTDLVAEMGIPVARVEAAYWVGVRRFWREWFAIAQAAAAAGEGTLEEFVGVPVELLFEYVTGVLEVVVARHEAVCARIRRSQEDTRRALVAQLLDGSMTAPIGDIERTLGYAITGGSHLALTLDLAGRSEVETCMSNLVARSEAQGFLIHLHGASRWVGWLRFARHPSGAVLDQITQVLAKVPVVATIGEPGEGLIGFRQSRSDALEAAGLRQRFPRLPSVLRFRDVRLEALLMRDEESARRFVVDELGELAGIGERLAIARETLLTWLVTGSSSQAAAALWIHENTVRVRTAQAEEMLPGELRTRRAEVLAALRLRAMFDGEPPAG